MPYPKSFSEHKTLPFSPRLVYQVVADIDRYPEFVPWCVSTQKISRELCENRGRLAEDGERIAEDGGASRGIDQYWEMSAGFRLLSDSYVSKVSLIPDQSIKAEAIDARLFKKLTTNWRFVSLPEDPERCLLDFRIEFEFSSYLYAYIANTFFMEVATKMVQAFEDRCNTLYVVDGAK